VTDRDSARVISWKPGYCAEDGSLAFERVDGSVGYEH
jgi:hypothetical protein